MKKISKYFLHTLICVTFGLSSIDAQNNSDLEGWSAIELDLEGFKKTIIFSIRTS